MRKTWRDFPEFYNNPTIKKLAGKEKWTFSTTKALSKDDPAKKPMDINAFAESGKLIGASFTDGNKPFTTLERVCEIIPEVTNNTFYLDYMEDNIVVLDIEPSCPQDIKEKLLKLPYLYGETSMSGKGYHLIFETPKIASKYPDAMGKDRLTHPDHYYEIMLNHYITFTRNTLPIQLETSDISEFEDLFESLAAHAKAKLDTEKIQIDNIDTSEIPYFKDVFNTMRYQKPKLTYEEYVKREQAKENEMDRKDTSLSGYEYSVLGFYYNCLEKLLFTNIAHGYEYTDKEKAIIIFKVAQENLDHREKHDTVRNGMPFLLYIVSTMVSANKADADVRKKKRAKKKEKLDELWSADQI